MSSKRIAQTNQQQKSEKTQASGILQRAAVRSISEAGVQSTDDQEVQPLRNSTFSNDFSRVPISTTKPQQIMAKQIVSPVVQQVNAPASARLSESETVQPKEMLEASRVQKENKAGLPDNLKFGIENLSGISMDDVKVQYNSPKPNHLQALAYTQGTDIYVAPRQEKHLAHEAWHVVQQKQGRVKPTMQAKGVAINDDTNLEREADVMGAKAIGGNAHELRHVVQQSGEAVHPRSSSMSVQEPTVQRVPADISVPQRVTVRKAFDKAINLCSKVINSSDEVLEPVVRRVNMRPTTERLKGIRLDFIRIKEALSNINIDGVQYDEQSDSFAYVYPNDPTRIVLGNLYFTASRKGEDSVAGTLIHEASHWSIVRGTDDHGYGDEISELAFTLARNNADTIERIAESFS